MSEPPRCPKCGNVPPIRKVDGSVGVDRITIRCNGGEGRPYCGEVYIVQVADLEVDELAA